MPKLEIFDPPMCCSTGVCGSSDDPTLVEFASDLEWLKIQGVEVVRHGLNLEPKEFVKNDYVTKILHKEGNGSLPIIFMNDKLVSKSCYPSREKLALICKIEYNDDEAPPIHREENCCCGVDCDCRIDENTEATCSVPECNCANAAAEDNCFCAAECEYDITDNKENFKSDILLLIFLFAVLGIIITIKMIFF